MAEECCYLTTTGRHTGRPHTVEIWYGRGGDTLYLLAGAGRRSDWVRNGTADAAVTVRFQDEQEARPARFRLVDDPAEDALARRLLLEKYFGGGTNEWGRTALPVAVDLVR